MEEIGRRLKAARMAKGLTLEEVEEETRIRRKYLEALETGRTDLIPGEVYVKGFLRSYGNFLGLDGDALVEEYKALKARPSAEGASNGTPAEAPAREPEAAVASAAARPATEYRQPAFVTPPRRASRSRAKRRRSGPGPGVYLVRRLMVALVVLLPLAGLGYWLWGLQADAPTPPDASVVQEPEPTAQEPEPQTEPEPEPEPAPPPEQQKPEGPVITVGVLQGRYIDIAVAAPTIDLRLNFAAPTWLEVYGPNDEPLYYAMASGTVEFQGQAFRVWLGNVGSFSLTINGQPVDYGLKAGGPYGLRIKTESESQ